MKKLDRGTFVLIGGLSAVVLAVVATLFWATHTRAGEVCVMILKAMDVANACMIASVGVVAGTTTAIYALSRLLSEGSAEERQKERDENKNDEN